MDHMEPVEVLTAQQTRQGVETVRMFENFLVGAAITSKELAIRTAKYTVDKSAKEYDVKLELIHVDFNEPDSIESFINYCTVHRKLMNSLRNDPNLSPQNVQKTGIDAYPTFLFINPIHLAYLDEFQLGQEKSSVAVRDLKSIAKHGRLSIVFTPEAFSNTGTMYADVPDAYIISQNDFKK